MEASNMQKIREALVKIRRELNDYCNDCTLLDRMTEDPPDYTCLRDSLLEIERIVDAALSEPARNCDRFKTRKEARQYFDDVVCLRSNGCGSIDCKGCSYDSIDNPHRADCREQWIFAPAAERKGEGDGR